MKQTDDGSLLDDNGRVIHFSPRRFLSDICEGDCCFVCGRPPGAVAFNDEHILPNWIIRRCSLDQEFLSIPTGLPWKYTRYKVPCCSECNSAMGEKLEEPIREMVDCGFKALKLSLDSEKTRILYSWLAMIFLKTHLRDKGFRVHLDTRKQGGVISDHYDWKRLYFLHAVARSFHTGASWSRGVAGSLVVMPFLAGGALDRFDYADLFPWQCVMLRLDDIIFYASFADAGAAERVLRRRLSGVTGALNELQAREVFVDLVLANDLLELRPSFDMLVEYKTKSIFLKASVPEVRTRPMDFKMRGSLMWKLLHNYLGSGLGLDEETLDELRNGHISFLFREDGSFISDGRPTVL